MKDKAKELREKLEEIQKGLDEVEAGGDVQNFCAILQYGIEDCVKLAKQLESGLQTSRSAIKSLPRGQLSALVGRVTTDADQQMCLIQEFYYGSRDSQEELFKTILQDRAVTPEIKAAKDDYFKLCRAAD